MRRAPSFPAMALAAASLSGCGFHLQGHAPLPDLVRTPYLEAPDPQTDFVQSLQHAMLSNGAHLAQEKAKASAVVSIVKDSMARRTLVVSPTNQPEAYEVTYTVAFTVSTKDGEVLPLQELSVTRTYSFDESLLLAKGHEEDVLRGDMAQQLADQVMRRLASL